MVFRSLLGASPGTSPFGKFTIEHNLGEVRCIHADSVSRPVEDMTKKHGFDAGGGHAIQNLGVRDPAFLCDAQDPLAATDVELF